MAIISSSMTRVGNLATVTVVSDLVGTVFFHWYRDGAYVNGTVEDGANTGVQSFAVADGETIRVDVLDTIDPDFDAIANAPEGWPAIRTLFWVRSLDSDVSHYRVDRQRLSPDADAEPETVGTVPAVADQWAYSFDAGVVAEEYTVLQRWTVEFTVTPVDLAGNDGTPIQFEEYIVRRPDAPDFEIAYSAGTQRVTISEAA